MLGEWMKLYGEAVYRGKPCGIKGQFDDFALEAEDGTVYFFIHHLKINHHKDKLLPGGGAGAKAFDGVKRKFASVRWLDNGESVSFCQDTASGMFCFQATAYPYGVNLVVRVAVAVPSEAR